MSAYVVVRVDVTDPEAWKQYAAGAGPTVAQFGGKYIARGGDVIGLENFDDEGRRIVLLEFPDMATAEAWYRSPEYTQVKKLREKAGHARFLIVDGYEG